MRDGGRGGGRGTGERQVEGKTGDAGGGARLDLGIKREREEQK